MAEPKSILLYLSFQSAFDRLSDEKVGRLIKSLFPYVKRGVEPQFEDNELQLSFDFIRPRLDEDLEKYRRKCEINAANGRKGGDKVRMALNSEANGGEQERTGANGGECFPSEANGEKINKKEIKENINCIENKRETENKSPLSYAEQYENACKKYGKATLEDYLQRVETYVQSSGKVYADKLATACLWIERDIADNKLVIKNTTYDLDEYEEWAKTYTPKLSTQEDSSEGVTNSE